MTTGWPGKIRRRRYTTAKLDTFMALCNRLEVPPAAADTTRARLHEALTPATSHYTEAVE